MSSIHSSLLAVCTKVPHGLFSLLFPDECRVCHQALTRISRIPLCDTCSNSPRPFEAEFFCGSCKTPFRNEFPLDENGLCAVCRQGLRGFDAAYCYGAHEGALREAIHLFKYGKMRAMGSRLAGFMEAALPHDEAWDVVVPVPLHWRRQWSRGFNQAEVLARHMARKRKMRVVCALRRKRSTSSQAELSNAKRRENVSGAFFVSKPITGLRVLLVDDVMTTGATGTACAITLKRAGAKSVTLLTLARVDRRFINTFSGDS